MKKFLLYLCILVALLAGGIRCCPWLLTAYAKIFSVANGTKGADAIVVLAGDIETRLPRAIALSKDGYASRILLTDPRRPNTTLKKFICDEKDNAEAILRFFNMQQSVTTIPSLKGGAASTFDEAYDALAYCVRNHFSHIIIVTDNYHTRRSLYAFEKVFKGTAITVEAMGASNDVFNAANWWQTDRGIEAYFLEPLKYAVYSMSSKNVPFIKNY